MAVKTADIKKRVLRGNSTKYGPMGLFVGEHEGEWWATNKYWVTRAERVAPLLEQYNLSAGEPGAYEVNGTVRRANGNNNGISPQPPDVGIVLRKMRGFQPGIRVKVAGQEVFTRPDDGDLMALYLLADGSHAGLLADELAWLSDTATAPLPGQDDGTHLRYGDVSVLLRRSEATGGVSALVSAEVFRVIERGRYADEGRGGWVPAVEEPAQPRVLGIMMGMNYGD